MEYKIFYSWQDSTNAKFNRYFIEDALEMAIKQVKKDLSIEFSEIILDRDSKGISGSPNIPEILESKIRNCDIFISDLSIVNSPSKPKSLFKKIAIWILKKVLQPDPHKPFMNMNVIKEYGQAQEVLGKERIIGIMNYTYGNPHNDSNIIPFDIRQIRWPIPYTLNESNVEKKKEVKAKLAKDLTNAITTVFKTELTRKKEKYNPFMVYKQWMDLYSTHLKIQYFSTEKLTGYLNAISNGVKETRSVFRITGLSGLGKTRMVFESMSRTSSHNSLTNLCLYYNINDGIDNIILKLKDFAVSGERLIIVLDNCPINFHNEISSIIRVESCNLSLISIGPDTTTSILDKPINTQLINLTHNDFEPVIDQILEAYYRSIPEEDKNLIKRFAKGHTLLAYLLAEGRVSQQIELGRLTNPKLIDSLIGSQEKESEDRKVIRACSLFTQLGFFDEIKDEAEFIAKHPIITELNLSDEASILRFSKICNKHIDRGILEKQGRYIVVRLKPLAISLAVEWWEKCPKDYAVKVIDELKLKPLGRALCDQMKYLDYLDNAKEITESLCGPEGPFGNAEVLNTNEGSRLFRSLVEVNPISTSKALARIFLSLSLEELLNIVGGRRNIIWSLEKLVFRKETFSDAAKTLLHFAVAENESISNNATFQFIQLFQTHLAGTEVNYNDRILIIDYALTKNLAFCKLAIMAMQRSFAIRNISRMLGAENQGSGPGLEDYTPTNQEIKDYWGKLIARLTEISISDSPISEFSSEVITNSLRSAINMGFLNILRPSIEKLVELNKYDWKLLSKKVNECLVYEKAFLTPEDSMFLKSLYESITPKDFRSIYIITVANPNYDKVFIGEETEIDITKKAEDLALIAYKENLLFPNLDIFYYGDQGKGYSFGKVIGRLLKENDQEVLSFFTKSLEFLNSIDANERNFSVLHGFLSELTDNLKKKYFLEQLFEYHALRENIFNIAAGLKLSIENFDLLFQMVDKYSLGIENFTIFKYGRALDHLNSEEISKLALKINSYGNIGSWTSLAILFMYSYESEKKWKLIKDVIKEIIQTEHILKDANHISSTEYYYWTTLTIKLIEEEKSDELIQRVTKEVLEFIGSSDSIMLFDSEIRKLFEYLIREHFLSIWPFLSEALLLEGENYFTYFKLKYVLGSTTSYEYESEGLLFQYQNDEIFKWCKRNTPNAPARLAEMAPLTSISSKEEWHPFTWKLINEFGEHNEVLKGISVRLGTHSWVGSIVPLLEMKKRLIEKFIESEKIEIRNWAQNEIINLEEQIRRENNFDEEYLLV